jgi:sugar phosphate isomerase/epimerase
MRSDLDVAHAWLRKADSDEEHMPKPIANSPALNRRQLLTNAAKATGLGAAAVLFPLRSTHSEDAKMPTGFKYAICNETFGDWPFEKAFALAAECGYRGIEIAPFTIAGYVTDIPAKRRTEVRRLAEKKGLEVVGLHWLLAKTKGFHLTSADVEVRRKTAQYLGQLARFCADLGGKIMVFGSPKQRDIAPGMSREQGMKYAAEVFRAVVPALEKTDVRIALEPLGPADTNFMTTAADGVELMNMVDSPRVRLHLDCKAMASEPMPEGKTPAAWIADLIRKYRGVFVHFHANDPNLQGPGFGKLDFVPIMKALGDVDYRGWVSVEVFDYRPGPERLSRESIRYLQQCVAQLDKRK